MYMGAPHAMQHVASKQAPGTECFSDSKNQPQAVWAKPTVYGRMNTRSPGCTPMAHTRQPPMPAPPCAIETIGGESEDSGTDDGRPCGIARAVTPRSTSS
jgi:hypothetical protein